MAVFIPPFMGQEIKSTAERRMFDVLQGLEVKNAYVLHSLGLPRHESKIYGEVDFVVVCERGIACLEIKGGRVACHDGKWQFIDRFGHEHERPEGPFSQVTGNMFSLRNEVKKAFPNDPHVKNILMASGVVFPDIAFHSDAEEIISEIIYDSTTKDITAYIEGVFDYWESRNHRQASKLPPSVITEIVAWMRGDFCFIPTLADRIERVDEQLVHLTREQARIVDALSGNSHLLIEGSAGTGKTVLALYAAKKQAEQGRRTLLLTYNKNLSRALARDEVVQNCENLCVINIHAFFGDCVDVQAEEVEADPGAFFGRILPERFCEYMTGLSEKELDRLMYDVLILDEGQDLIKTEYLYALDMVLRGGLENGDWFVFYDEKQNIYNPDYEDGMELLKSYNSTRFQLFTNCRNTKQIGEYGAAVSGITPAGCLHETGEEVCHIRCRDESEFATKINDILKSLKKEHIDMRDITFLGPKRYDGSSLKAARIPVHEIENDDTSENLPCYATLQGFKGLDSRVVILIDVDYIRPENHMKFMYIAATRARVLLYVVEKE